MLDVVREISDAVRGTLTGMATTARFAWENWRGQGGGSAITRRYPEEPLPLSEAYRGHLVNDTSRCIVCKACQRVCPADCFVIEGERTADNKLAANRFDIDVAKCMYCGLCVRTCPTGSLTMSGGANGTGAGLPILRATPEQVDITLTRAEMALLKEAIALPDDQRSPAMQALLERLSDQAGTRLTARYGLGLFTDEEKAAIQAERARKAAEKAAKAAAAQDTAPGPGTSA